MVTARTVSLLLQSSHRSVQVQRLLIAVVLLRRQYRISRPTCRVEGSFAGLSILARWRVTGSPMTSVHLLALEAYSRLWLGLCVDTVGSGEVVRVAVIWVEVGRKL